MHITLLLLCLLNFLCLNWAYSYNSQQDGKRNLKLKLKSVICNEDELKCKWDDGFKQWPYCIPNAMRCNRKDDCADGIDEDPKTCQFIKDLSKVTNVNERLKAVGHNVCRPQTMVERVKLLIVVDSEAKNLHRRHELRDVFNNAQGFKPGEVRVVYFVGKSMNKQQQGHLRTEQSQFKDVVLSNVWQPATKGQHFRTIKALSSLDWVLSNCPNAPFVLKIDEFMNIVNIRGLMNFIRTVLHATNTIWTFVNEHMGQHCWNTPYLMTRNAIKLLVTGSLKPRRYFENDEEYLIKKVAAAEDIDVRVQRKSKFFKPSNSC